MGPAFVITLMLGLRFALTLQSFLYVHCHHSVLCTPGCLPSPPQPCPVLFPPRLRVFCVQNGTLIEPRGSGDLRLLIPALTQRMLAPPHPSLQPPCLNGPRGKLMVTSHAAWSLLTSSSCQEASPRTEHWLTSPPTWDCPGFGPAIPNLGKPSTLGKLRRLPP